MKKSLKTMLAALALFAVGMSAFVIVNLPKQVAASDTAFDLSLIADGTYTGSCENGIVKVKLEVDVSGGEIAAIRIIEHDNGLGAPAEAITAQIVARQSLEVDVVAGATYSSQTILKAAENALAGE